MDVENTAQQALDSARAAHYRLDKLEDDVKDVHTLAVAMAGMQEEMSNVKSDVGEIKDSVKAITNKPAQWWELLVQTLITAFAGGLCALLLSHIH